MGGVSRSSGGLPLRRDGVATGRTAKSRVAQEVFRPLVANKYNKNGRGPMHRLKGLAGCSISAVGFRAIAACLACIVAPSAAYAHGGGLDANGCHTNRKTGEYHCHRGGVASNRSSALGRTTLPERSISSLASSRTALNGLKCYIGPRGGTYTITASGRKDCGGC